MLARPNQTHRIGIIVALAVAMAWQNGTAHADNADRIQPWSENPAYWQYKGQPVMLLGGSKTDHIFLLDDLKEHLDEIHAVGANYVRNTMSQREGIELKPHKLLPDGKFDMDQWNDDYWQRFQNMLKWTHEREIIVQIEVWDRFDFSQQNWEISPWNPGNNVNYTYEQTGFAAEYRAHPGQDRQPFFHSIPGMPNYHARLDRIRRYQEAFIDKMLGYSLGYGHVLYCMNNETSTSAAWGQCWINFIRARAAEKGVTVWATDMFDDAYLGPQAKNAPIVFDDPEHYMFADISQVNSRNFDQTHCDRLRWLLQQISKHPRPSNHTKIYGSGYHSFRTGGPEDGIERFWRNILGGSAAARFHRPNSGNGLNDLAKGSIMAARLLESQIKFWDITPHMELLSDREPNEAYLAAKPGESYALVFTNGGSVRLDLSGAPGTFSITWISVAMSGDDNAAGTAAAMWRTIQKAVAIARAGDTVVVHGGVYTGHVIFRHSGQPDKPIVLKSAPGQRPVFDGERKGRIELKSQQGWRSPSAGSSSRVSRSAMAGTESSSTTPTTSFCATITSTATSTKASWAMVTTSASKGTSSLATASNPTTSAATWNTASTAPAPTSPSLTM